MNGKVFLLPLARLLMSSLFIQDGIGQLLNPGGTAQYFASVHVPTPDIAVWLSIPIHLLGGLALLAGFYSRWAATLLALVCVGTALGVPKEAGLYYCRQRGWIDERAKRGDATTPGRRIGW
jgi:putative oxidoreductase